MTIDELKKTFIEDAKTLGDYDLLSKTELANGYCDADENNDVRMKSAYFSALMLRYWYKIFAWKLNSKSLKLEDDEFVTWLAECLYDTFYYRSWRYEYKAIVKNGKFIDWKLDSEGNKIINPHYWLLDPNSPDKSINYFTSAKRGKVYQYYNKEKRKLNVISSSLDQQLELAGESVYNESCQEQELDTLSPVNQIVDYFVKKDKIIEALIINGIVNYDSFKTIKDKKIITLKDEETGEDYQQKIQMSHSEFDPRRVVKYLNSLDENLLNDFYLRNCLPLGEVEKTYSLLKSLNNKKLYNYIKKTLYEIKQTPVLVDMLK